MLDFQAYQAAFTAHIRNPQNPKPRGVPDVRMAVYREGVFNNLFEVVSACFPVCQAVLGKRAWKKLVRDFFKTYGSKSPIFREIPQQFLNYLETTKDLPAYFNQLAHYEWVELAVSALEAKPEALSEVTDLLNEQPVFAPNMLLVYDFPVNKISKRFKPTTPEPAYLLVYRRADFEVKFTELNSITYQLLHSISENNLTGIEALTRLSRDIQHPDTDVVIKFGLDILNDLAHQGAITGSKK